MIHKKKTNNPHDSAMIYDKEGHTKYIIFQHTEYIDEDLIGETLVLECETKRKFRIPFDEIDHAAWILDSMVMGKSDLSFEDFKAYFVI